MNLSSVPVGFSAFIVGLAIAIPTLAVGAFVSKANEPKEIHAPAENSFVTGSVNYGTRE